MEIFSPLHPRRVIRLKRYITHFSGLVAYWPLWENDGTVAVNHAPDNLRSLNGTVNGATVGQSGLLGKAYDFDGDNDTISVTKNTAFNTVDLSIFMLLNPDALRIQGVIGKNDNTATWRVFMNDTNGTLEFDAVSDTDNIEATTDISANVWSSFGVTYDKSATTAIIYINGVAAGTTATFTDAVGENDSNVIIAPDDTNEFNGQIQHVAMFNTPLSAAKMLKLAQKAGLA